jgi:hypothetical protein
MHHKIFALRKMLRCFRFYFSSMCFFSFTRISPGARFPGLFAGDDTGSTPPPVRLAALR